MKTQKTALRTVMDLPSPWKTPEPIPHDEMPTQELEETGPALRKLMAAQEAHNEVFERLNYLLGNAAMDLQAGDIEVARQEVLEAQRIIYDQLR